MRTLISSLKYLSAVAIFTAAANATNVPVGTINFDLTGLPGTATIDIANQTGPNSSAAPDTTFPVTTSVPLTGLSLTLNFTGGVSESFGSSYFTLASDGLSFDGSTISISTPVTSATVTGTFADTAWTLNDGSTVSASPNFTATITDPTGTLANGDFSVVYGATGTSVTPEPGTWLLLAVGFGGLFFFRYRASAAQWFPAKRIQRGVPLLFCAIFMGASLALASSSVKLNTSTTPSSGISGTSLIWVTGSGFPNGTIDPSSVSLALQTSCGVTAGETAATATAVRPIIGTSEKVEFQIPASVVAGNYFVTLSGRTTGGTAFSSSNCSEVAVQYSSTAVGSCNPGSSMGMLVPAKGKGTATVTAYVPNSAWGGSVPDVEAVPVEGSGSPATITTANAVNSCSTDSVTGVTACTANGFPADVYLISGNRVTKTVTTASNAAIGFSGGGCYNCGVAVNAVTHQAAITMGYSGATSALQFLDLAKGSLGAPIPTAHEVSEDILWDPFLNLILSPDESSIYSLYSISGSGLPGTSNVGEFGQAISSSGGGEFDSAGEDCTTGIALTTEEESPYLYITDLKQAKFTRGTPGSWTAPGQDQYFPEFEALSAGTSAIAVAPGSTHLGVVAGEFGGNAVGVIQLPSTSGTGTPAVVDYALAYLPNTPDGNGFSNGYDPHTTTAYTSPNNEKAYAVQASWATGAPTYLAIIDIQAMLNAPRTAGTHNVDPSYDLLTNGVVRYVATH